MITIDRIDHLVLTVKSIELTGAFYSKVLGMKIEIFGKGRKSLVFGNQKINLHQADTEAFPKSAKPTPGSLDLCLITETPIDDVILHLERCKIELAEGPLYRNGALGEIKSVYFYDPDGNLIEVSNY